MLNFNAPPLKNSTAEPVWKVLIYDRFGQDIISPLLSVKELRDMGITLHLLLHSDRDPIPDVPAIFFVMPTEENIDRICQDLRNQLYESYYLNFISAISRSKLEDIASAALAANAVNQVTKVFDQYLNFITLEDDMFILCNQNKEHISYHAINKPDIMDTDMEGIMDTIVDSLFCFFVTLGAVPIIRCPRGNAAEMVAVKLDKKLRENLRDARNSLFTGDTMGSGQFSFQRPLFVLADRNLDLATPLHHTWTYQALIHDVLDFHLNRVSVDESQSSESSPAGARPKKKNKKSYDLTAADKFWQKHKGSPFPEVAEAVQEELDTYRAQEDEVKRLKSIMLLEKKRLIDLHTNVATAVLDHIKTRKLDVYFEFEEKLMSKSTLDKSLLDIISDPDAGTAEDKMRLFLIYYITSQQPPSESDLEQYKKAMVDAGCDLSPLNYIKQWKAFTKMAATPASYGASGVKPMGLFSRVMNTGSQFVMEGVKNLVLKQHNLPVTRILDNLMEMKSNPETDEYRYFDPKMLRGSESSIPRNKNPFQEARQGKRVLYGCSELFNAAQFIKQSDRWRRNGYWCLFGDLGGILEVFDVLKDEGYLIKTFWTCKVDGFLILLFGLISINTLTAISVIRYIKGCQPHNAHHINKRNICLVITEVWLFSLFWAGAPLLGWGSYRAQGYGTCEIDWTQALHSVPFKLYAISIFFFNFFVPLFIIVFTYVCIIRRVNSSHKFSRGGDVSERQRKMERSITRVSMILCAAFLLAWSPYAVISMWSALGFQVPPLNGILASLFAKSASFYNPFIYIGMSSKFRKDLQALFSCPRPTSTHRDTPPVLLAQPADVQLSVDGFKVKEATEPGHNAGDVIHEGKSESPFRSEHLRSPFIEYSNFSPHRLMRKHSNSGRL
ncbi:hypothetical protein DNTS_028862 [Danionella cerebrum]|uniref:Sec1 family domain-containing protein 1 n=1 Tax=Danionella cerebrum TaxID=2873325 RepID=A0A553Q4X5_9TELE|nr:hypothetical protein DNTS_028862 [Danionella translucida]